MENNINNTFDIIIKDIDRINSIDSKSLLAKVLKFNEEYGEFAQELGKLIGITHKPYDEDHFIEESADALQVLLSIQLAACKLKNIPFEKILFTILEKDKKWELLCKEYIKNKK